MMRDTILPIMYSRVKAVRQEITSYPELERLHELDNSESVDSPDDLADKVDEIQEIALVRVFSLIVHC